MIGKLRIPHAEQPIEARLDTNLQWDCDDPEVARMLNELFPAEQGVDDIKITASLGRHRLYQASYRLGAEVEPTAHAAQAS